jgi:hypothetical protein
MAQLPDMGEPRPHLAVWRNQLLGRILPSSSRSAKVISAGSESPQRPELLGTFANATKLYPTCSSMPRFVEGTGVPPPDNNEPGAPENQVPDRVRVKNRRKTYLDAHPEYFGPQLELAGLP